MAELRPTLGAIEIEAQGMGGEFGIQANTEAPEAMGMIALQVELRLQLAVDGLNHLAQAVDEATQRSGKLAFLVATRQGEQANTLLLKQFEGEEADPLKGMFENLASLEDRIVGVFAQKTVETTRTLITD